MFDLLKKLSSSFAWRLTPTPDSPARLSLEVMVHALRQAGHHSVADELLTRDATAATGGERVDGVCSRLLGLKQQYPGIYGLVQPEAEVWLMAGRQGGVIFPSVPEGGY